MFSDKTKELIGSSNFQKISQTKIAIFGIGGVGGTVAEILTRIGIQNIYLVDYDTVNITNLNRQILFDRKDLKKKKVFVAKKHLKAINQNSNIYCFDFVFNQKNIALLPFEQFDYVIDAIDDVDNKIVLIKYLIKHKIPFISSLGMGNRTDLSKIKINTLNKTFNDPLAKKIRNKLRNNQIDLSKINVVSSDELPIKNKGKVNSIIIAPFMAGLLIANYIFKKIINENN